MLQISAEQLLRTGLWHHQNGRFAEAEQIYRQVLTQPISPALAAEILHQLGVLLAQNGRTEEGIACLRRCIDMGTPRPVYFNDLGLMQTARGRPAEAVAALTRAIETDPAYAEAHYNLA